MTRDLIDAVDGLGAAVALIAVAIVAIRVAERRRRARAEQLRPRVELELAAFLAESGPEPAPRTGAERGALRDAAVRALAELTGAERARVVTLLDRLGFVQEAARRMRARRRIARRKAVELLALAGGDVAGDALRLGLEDRDALVRTAAARGLAASHEPDVVRSIAGVIARDLDEAPGAVASVVLALGLERPDDLAPLLAAEVNPELRALAATVAGRLRLAQHAPLLRAALEADDTLAEQAAAGLGAIGDDEAVALLARLVDDDDRSDSTRTAAAAALGEIGDPSCAPELERAVASGDWNLREAAATALASLGAAGREALERARSTAHDEARAQVEVALAR